MNVEPKAHTDDEIIRAARQRWGTPAIAVRNLARIVQAPITLDVCAEKWSAKAPTYFGPGGLSGDAFTAPSWARVAAGGVAFCNPPFIRIAPWVSRLLSECARARAAGRPPPLRALLWIPPRTDQAWWHWLLRGGKDRRTTCCRPIYVKGRVEHDLPPELAELYARKPKKKGGAGGGIVVWAMGFPRSVKLPTSITREDLGWTAAGKWSGTMPPQASTECGQRMLAFP